MVPRHPGDVWRSVRDAVPPTDDTYAGFDEWFERAARGDPEGLAALWRQYQPLLLRYFRGRLPDVAEDLASTVWIDVASSLASFRGDEDGFRGWLFTIAHRRLVDEHWRRERRPADRRRRPEPCPHNSPRSSYSAARLILLDHCPRAHAARITITGSADARMR